MRISKLAKINFSFLVFQLIFQLILSWQPLMAEDPTLGRLPDGRAFRTDREGNQLVDYIAELELEVESLKRQVRGLEDENSDKQAALSRLSGGKEISPKLVEKDLGSPAQVLPECKPKIVEKIVETECKPKIIEAECKPKIVEKVVERIVEKPSACLPAVQSADNKALEKEVSGLKIELAKANQELDQQSVDLEILTSKLENQKKLALIQPAISTPSMPPGIVKDKPARGQVSDVRFKAVDMLRRTMLQDLRSFEDLVAYRNKLYGRVDRNKFPPPEKVNVQEFRQNLQNAEQVHDLSQIRSQISEQRGKVQQEIALYKRELKIR